MYSKAIDCSYSLCFFHAGTIAASIINFISLFTVMYTYPPFNLSNWQYYTIQYYNNNIIIFLLSISSVARDQRLIHSSSLWDSCSNSLGKGMQFTSVAWINDHVNKFTLLFKTRTFLYLNINLLFNWRCIYCSYYGCLRLSAEERSKL